MSRLVDILPRIRMLPPATLPCTYGAVGGPPKIPDNILKPHAAAQLFSTLCSQLRGVPRFIIDDIAAFTLLNASNPDWPMVGDPAHGPKLIFPRVMVPGGNCWFEYHTPAEIHPTLDACFGIKSLPTSVGWFVNRLTENDCAASGCMPGIVAFLAMRYKAAKGDRNEFCIFPAAKVYQAISEKCDLTDNLQVTFIGDIEPRMICDVDMVTALCTMLFWPVLVTMTMIRDSVMEATAPTTPPKVAANRAKKGWLPDLDYYNVNASASINRLRMDFQAGLIGIAEAMAHYAQTHGRKIILPSELR